MFEGEKVEQKELTIERKAILVEEELGNMKNQAMVALGEDERELIEGMIEQGVLA